MDPTETKKYEIGYLMSPLIVADQLNDAVDKEITAIIKNQDGVVTGQQSPEMKILAYPIGRTTGHKKTIFKEAYFGALYFDLKPDQLAELKQKLAKSEMIIRFMIIAFVKEGEKLSRPRRRESLAEPVLNKNQKMPPAGKKTMNESEIDREIEGLLTSV